VKITGLQIDGFGVWSGLQLDDLSDGLNVFCGPNEAGKTTLMQFIRSMLYGFSAEREQYFPPVHGGRSGGALHVAGPNGRFQVVRHVDGDSGFAPGRALLVGADGTRQGEHLLRVLLCNIEEPVFNNVFAVGLREMQQLGALGDTEAAALLYRISAGVDSVSLFDVVHELQNSRRRLIDPEGGNSQMAELLKQRDQLKRRLDDSVKMSGRYGRLLSHRNQLDVQVTELEEERNRVQHEARIIEVAVGLADRWQRREQLDEQLSAMGPLPAMPEAAMERLEDLNRRFSEEESQVNQLRQRWEALRSEAGSLKVNEALWRQAARIEALGEQQPWITGLEKQIGELRTEINQLESQITGQQKRLGLDKHGNRNRAGAFSEQAMGALRQPARVLRYCRRNLKEARAEVERTKENQQELTSQLEEALVETGEDDLHDALERAGAQVSQLRRRAQVDKRLEELHQYQEELEQRSHQLMDRQMMPVLVLVGLGGAFVLGVMLLLVGLFLPTSIIGTAGWWLSGLGLLGGAGAAVAKVVMERTNARRLEAAQKQINMLQLQLRQAGEERDELERQLPSGGGPVLRRLELAEESLKKLEGLVPLETRLQAAQQEYEAASSRSEHAGKQYADAKRRWQQELRKIGLPTGLSPKQVRDVVQQTDEFGQGQRRLERKREELQQRRRELESITSRIAQLASDCGVDVEADHPVELVELLRVELSEQEGRMQRRQGLKDEARQIRRQQRKHQMNLSRLKHQHRRLLREADVKDERQFRERAMQVQRAETLRQERESLQSEITAALGGLCTEEAMAERLRRNDPRRLEKTWDDLVQRGQSLESKLKQALEQRGQIGQQLKTLVEDREPAKLRLQLGLVERQIRDAARRWQVVAVSSAALERIRTVYERQRQPETLQEASGYMQQMTDNRYQRVWTPLGEDVLYVDDESGHSLPVQALSRGTREQLFLSLRLALANSYARRGAMLPLILDDVLVNFDAKRAKAAANVLKEFASVGHQLMVFTCHEHVAKLFASKTVEIRRLDHMDHVGQRRQIRRRGGSRTPAKTTEPAPAASRQPAVPHVAAEIEYRPQQVEFTEVDPPHSRESLEEEKPVKRARREPAVADEYDDGEAAYGLDEESFDVDDHQPPETDDEYGEYDLEESEENAGGADANQWEDAEYGDYDSEEDYGDDEYGAPAHAAEAEPPQPVAAERGDEHDEADSDWLEDEEPYEEDDEEDGEEDAAYDEADDEEYLDDESDDVEDDAQYEYEYEEDDEEADEYGADEYEEFGDEDDDPDRAEAA
jgi:uncharacterized protein YhaN